MGALEMTAARSDRVAPAEEDRLRRPLDPGRVTPGLPITGLPRPFNRWMRALESVHGSRPSPVAALVDATLGGVAAGLAGLDLVRSAIAGAALVVCFYLAAVYADRDTIETQGVLWYPAKVAVPATLLTLGGAVADGHVGVPVIAAVPAGVIAVGLLTLARSATWVMLSVGRRRGRGLHRTVLIGTPATVQRVGSKLASYPEAGLAPVASVLVDSAGLSEDPAAACRRFAADHAIVAPADAFEWAIGACLESLDGMDVRLSVVPPLEDLFLSPGLVAQVGGLPLIPLARLRRTRTSLPAKRAFDVVGALVLLVLLAPVMAVAAAAVLADGGRPVLYRQRRVGRHGTVFEMLKFRSMVRDADARVIDLTAANVADGLLFKLSDDPRVTRVGRLLRRFAVDELPQLWNVVKGDMSLVGPRPLALEPTQFGALDSRRHSVRPGITGYWQISGGNGLTWSEMVKLDLAYLENWSLWLDLRLLARTVPALISRRGPW